MIKKLILALVVSLSLVLPGLALEVRIVPIDYVNGRTLEQNSTGATLTRRDFFEFVSELTDSDLRESYKFIKLEFTDVKQGSDDYDMLQKIIYLTLIDNSKGKVSLDKPVSAYSFYSFIEKVLDLEITPKTPKVEKILKSRYANEYDIEKVRKMLAIGEDIDEDEGAEMTEKKDIFDDVYNTLIDSHYDLENLDHKKMIYSSIQGLAEGTGDKHTVYFPPIESKSFTDGLAGEVEGIGAYVDFSAPGVLYIKSPIPDSPAEKAGLKPDDIIVKVGANLVTKDNSLSEVVSWIKGPAGTDVKLEILRGTETLYFTVTRARVIIKDVESRVIDGDTLYIALKSFGNHASDEFTATLTGAKDNQNINKIVFDLRNNPGGFLNVVNDMLGHFAPKGELVSQIKYRDYTINNKSKGKELLNFANYKLVILQNEGTASASEIFIGTIKDYFPDTTIIGVKSYGKGSVQTIKSYVDGSSLKYTVAKWFTGKSQTGIDGVGIEPDIILELDTEAWKKDRNDDNQLKKALDL